MIKEDRDEAAIIIRNCMNLIHLLATSAAPVIPHMSRDLLSAFDKADAPLAVPGKLLGLDALPAGHAFTVIPPIVAKIADEDVAAHEERFGR